MKAWFDSLSDRERWMVIAAVAATVIFLLYFILVRPLLNTNAELRDAVATKQGDYAWMKEKAADAKSKLLAGPAKQTKDNRTLIARVTAELRTKKISPAQVKPEGERRLSLSLKDTVFIDLMERLEYLHTGFNIRVAKASIEPGSETGLVNAQVTLAR
jgi:general secretion pathway protein M